MTFLYFLIFETLDRIREHNLSAYSAQMAYFFLLSIFPFLIVLFAVAGKLDMTYSVMSAAYMQVMPQEAFSIIDAYIRNLLEADLDKVLPISLLASLWTASNAMSALERALSVVYDVPQPRKYLRSRLFGMLMTVLLLLILLIALILPNLSKAFLTWLSLHMWMPINYLTLIAYGRWVLMLTLFILVLSIVHLWMPKRSLTLKQILPGVIFTMVGWTGLSIGFSMFLRYFSNISFVYGSLGAVITLMIWLYLIGMLLMLGGEINDLLIKWENNS